MTAKRRAALGIAVAPSPASSQPAPPNLPVLSIAASQPSFLPVLLNRRLSSILSFPLLSGVGVYSTMLRIDLAPAGNGVALLAVGLWLCCSSFPTDRPVRHDAAALRRLYAI